ncbi:MULTISPECIES: hypothetical protein [Pseudomonas]|uniref:hypothetical protein n=1 Tax=Pseudomonas TaxID=286 RepID=UPI001D080200|nr:MULTISPECIES: hypothetical protein [Pseudomonas]MCX4220164.1 hypothetical protein [Pseudomonas sp. MCal1]UIN54768.1 hypothetical protein LXN51_00010 [Pseudomonas kribbensis]
MKVADLDLFTPWLGRCALVFAGLSAAWFMEDDEQKAAAGQLKFAGLAASALDV